MYDAGGEDLFVFRGVEEAFQLDLGSGGELLSARLNDAGWLAVTYQGGGHKGSVTVYDGTYTKEIIKINLPHALILGVGLSAMLYASGGTSSPWNYAVMVISLPCMSIFFSVHYLTLYYLLQPYNAGTEMKSGTYQLLMSLTYLACFLMMQVRMPTLVFGAMTIVFCAIYCLAACLLIYRFAPKTFRLRA